MNDNVNSLLKGFKLRLNYQLNSNAAGFINIKKFGCPEEEIKDIDSILNGIVALQEVICDKSPKTSKLHSYNLVLSGEAQRTSLNIKPEEIENRSIDAAPYSAITIICNYIDPAIIGLKELLEDVMKVFSIFELARNA